MPVYDQTADQNYRELHRLSKLYPFPDWVKSAKHEDIYKPKALSAGSYADDRNKQFPCHTKAATFLSTLYFLENRSVIPVKDAMRIADRLTKFADRHGISNTVRELSRKHAQLHLFNAEALPDSDYALVRTNADGSKDRRYMLRNSLEVKVAADWLAANRDELPFVDRRTIAGKILEKAARYGAALGDKLSFLERQAGHGMCDPKKVAEQIRRRVKAAERLDPVIRDRMLTLAATVERGGPFLFDIEKMAGVVAAVEDFDRVTGVWRGYGEYIKRAEDVVFEATFKEASAFVRTACELQTGSVYEPEQFEKLSVADVSSLFGDEFADQVSTGLQIDGEKMATLARTLPRGDARLLERLMGDAGMTPVVKRAAEARNRVTRTLLAEAAKNYKPTVTGSF